MIAPAALAPSELVTELPRLRRYARVLTGEVRQADDLVMDTLERARRCPPQQALRTALRPWLFALMHETNAGRRTPFPNRPAPEVTGTWPAAASVPEKPSRLLVHFGGLPVDEREVLLLVAVEGMAYEEIAGVLGVPLATVVARLKRARDLVRAADSSGPTRGPPMR